MRLPDFYIIGAMKAGSTTLDATLRRHPSLFLCPIKEPQFFSRDHVYAKGLEWYGSLFDDASDNQLVGESSTCYSRDPVYPDACARIAQHTPDAKFLYIVRHPVDRFVSHYGHAIRVMIRDGASDIPTFRRFIEEDEEAHAAGLYAHQHAIYADRFGADRVKIVLFEELRSDARAHLDEIQRFLGVDPIDLTDDGALPRFNAREDVVRRTAARHLVRTVRDAPVVSSLRKLVPSGLRGKARKSLLSTLEKSAATSGASSEVESRIEPLTDELRALILERYAPSTERFEQLIGRQLPEWRR